MELKNLKNLNSPKYRMSIASVLVIGGGIIYFGLRSFGPNMGGEDSVQSGRSDDRVRIDPSAIRGSQGIRRAEVSDYDIDDNSEMARVYRQSRDDDRGRALEGDGSFVFTLSPNDDEEVKEDVKEVKEEVQKEPEEEPKKEELEEEDNMEGQEPPSFQNQLRNTRSVRNEERAPPRADPMSQQRNIYQQTNQNQAGGQQGNQLLGDILAKAEFKHQLRGFELTDEIGESSIFKRTPYVASNDQEDDAETLVEVNERNRANDYASYIGSNKTEQVHRSIKINPGDIFYTRLQIGINTDEVSPVRAEIISGELAGAVLLGYPKRAGKKAVIELDVMSFNGVTYDIDAVALDMETQRTGMADHVESHYGKNLFYLTMTSIISGYANSLQSWEESSSSGLGGETVKKKQRLDSFEDRLLVGIGEAGDETKDIFRNQINREPTVHVHPKDIAIMFMGDITISGKQ